MRGVGQLTVSTREVSGVKRRSGKLVQRIVLVTWLYNGHCKDTLEYQVFLVDLLIKLY